jgi:hypothetical protein
VLILDAKPQPPEIAKVGIGAELDSQVGGRHWPQGWFRKSFSVIQPM